MYELKLTEEECQVLMGLMNGANVPAQIVDTFVSLRNKVKEVARQLPERTPKE